LVPRQAVPPHLIARETAALVRFVLVFAASFLAAGEVT
jgi:hypothetical protein